LGEGFTLAQEIEELDSSLSEMLLDDEEEHQDNTENMSENSVTGGIEFV